MLRSVNRRLLGPAGVPQVEPRSLGAENLGDPAAAGRDDTKLPQLLRCELLVVLGDQDRRQGVGAAEAGALLTGPVTTTLWIQRCFGVVLTPYRNRADPSSPIHRPESSMNTVH